MTRILIVEDETLVAMLIEDMLVELGHEVVSTKRKLATAMAAAETMEIDAVILDLNLAGENTLPVAETLQRRGIPFVFSTGYGSAGPDGRFSEMPIVTKPFTKHEMGAAIAKCLDA